MPVEPVAAFRISNGNCFISKQDAYNAETKQLYEDLKRLSDKAQTTAPNVLKEFKKIVASLSNLVSRSNALIAQQDNEQDVETKRSIAGQG